MANLWSDEYTPTLEQLLTTRTRYSKIANAINKKFGTTFDAHFVCKVASRLKLSKAPSEALWPAEHDAKLVELYRQIPALGFAEIAQALNREFGTGYTKNACISKSKRLKLSGKPDGVRSSYSTNPRIRLVPVNGNPNGKAKRAVLLPDLDFSPRCVGVEPRHLSLMDLQPWDCRYPYGGDKAGEPITFCGHPKFPNSSYCPAHTTLCQGSGTYSERAAHVVSKEVAA
jgi:GcrA cell cycle regulator